jgi:glucose/arabinose dehydrogenase
MNIPILKRWLSLVGLVLLFVISSFGSAKSLENDYEPSYQKAQMGIDPTKLQFQEIAGGFNQPLLVTNAGDGSNRVFVVEKAGRIWIVKDGIVQAVPFLDIQSLVNSTGGEQGLLALAFHPNYHTNGQFYVVYTDYTSPVGSIVLARFTKSSTNPDLADPASRTTILTISEPYENHNGGTLAFGPDGYLYWSIGDGGSGGDPQNNAQNLTSFLGKILRLDVNSGVTYTIPLSNPFYNAVPSIKKEIWSYGLRNPWRFSFDRATGDLYIGDVGQNEWEEIDWQPVSSSGGENYGWRILEGTHCYSPPTGCIEPNGYVPPVTEYPHTVTSHDDNGCSVTGGYVYRGSAFPALEGLYFYGDFCLGKIYSLYYDAKAGWTNSLLVDTPFTISSFGEDEQGELYVVDYSSGKIYQIQYPSIAVPNDEVSSPKVIAALPFRDNIDVSAATQAGDDPAVSACNLKPGLASVWYSYTPVTSTPIFIDTFGSSYDTYLAIWTGSPGSLISVTCNDDWDNKTPQSGVGFNANAGTNYIIEIAEFNGWITPSSVPHPTNQELSGLAGRTLQLNVVVGIIREVDIYIGAMKMNAAPYVVAPSGEESPIFPGIFDGPVEVVSTNGQDLIVSERQMYGSSFTETMGMPADQLTTDYWFPWYDGMTMSTWISIGAPDTNSADAQVDIYIGGVKMNTSPYVVSAGGQVSPSFPGAFDGPVEVVSTNGQDLIVSERQMYGSSFTETMGMPDNQLMTDYWFPWYDGMTMSTWISIGAP